MHTQEIAPDNLARSVSIKPFASPGQVSHRLCSCHGDAPSAALRTCFWHPSFDGVAGQSRLWQRRRQAELAVLRERHGTV